MDLKQRIIQTIVEHLPEVGGVDLSFFLDPTVFPVGDALGEQRNNWILGFTWLDGLGWTTESLEVIHFEYDFDRAFKGIFDIADMKVQILGDFDPPRGLESNELEFLKRELPGKCKLFAVCVHRPSLNKTTKSGVNVFVDAIVVYYSATAKRVPTPLQLLATQPNQAL